MNNLRNTANYPPTVLFAHGAALLGGGLVGEGGEAGGGAEEVGGAFALVGRLAFLQGLLTVGAGHLGEDKQHCDITAGTPPRDAPHTSPRTGFRPINTE